MMGVRFIFCRDVDGGQRLAGSRHLGNAMANVAFETDRAIVRAQVLAVVTAEAARKLLMADVVRMGLPREVHEGELGPVKDSLQAKKLEIVDGNGNVRIRLGPADEGYGLVVYDVDGKFRATLTDAPLGAVSQLSKDGGSIKLMALKDGCGITIRDKDGAPRALMLQQKEGSQIMLKDGKGKTVFSAPK